jgi:hypothetical protein
MQKDVDDLYLWSKNFADGSRSEITKTDEGGASMVDVCPEVSRMIINCLLLCAVEAYRTDRTYFQT